MQPTDSPQLDRPIRWFLLLLAAGLLSLLAVARGLEPDPRGFGSHEQLGLGPCTFAVLTGRLCPSCGMTTSLAWFTRGDPGRAWRANPMGCVLGPLIPCVAAWLAAVAILGRPVGFRSIDRPLMGLVVVIVVASLMFWMLRILGAPIQTALPGLPPAGGPR